MNYHLEKQHAKGKLHAIERIHLLLDRDSFHEWGSHIADIQSGENETKFPYDGVITGYGAIHGKRVYLYAQDFTVQGGTLGKRHGAKIAAVIKQAVKYQCPVIGINDSGGARIQEGIDSLSGYGEVFYYNTLASGYIPQISIIAGPCAGGAVYSPGLTDFIFTIDAISNMFVTGPKVIKNVTNQNISAEELGGAFLHSAKSGVSHFRCHDERECFQKVRRLLEILPMCAGKKEEESSNYQYIEKKEKFPDVLPASKRQSYDVKNVIQAIADKDSFLEIQEEFAPNLVTGFIRISGITTGIVANQPRYMAGVLDVDASDKGARFVRFCDAFDIPLVTFTDVPGFMPSVDQEEKGIIRHGAKLLYAYSEATTIKINVILRKAYGGAYIAMCSKHLRADAVYAWEGAEAAVMGAEGAVEILRIKETRGMQEKEKELYLKVKTAEYEKKYMNVDRALKAGYIDEIIPMQETRKRLYDDIMQMSNKREILAIHKKHGNMPL